MSGTYIYEGGAEGIDAVSFFFEHLFYSEPKGEKILRFLLEGEQMLPYNRPEPYSTADIQKLFFNFKNNVAHHHSLDKALRDLEREGLIIFRQKASDKRVKYVLPCLEGLWFLLLRQKPYLFDYGEFNCKSCHKPLYSLTRFEEESVGEGALHYDTTYYICVNCKKVYSVSVCD